MTALARGIDDRIDDDGAIAAGEILDGLRTGLVEQGLIQKEPA
jgi:hypothetical protein